MCHWPAPKNTLLSPHAQARKHKAIRCTSTHLHMHQSASPNAPAHWSILLEENLGKHMQECMRAQTWKHINKRAHTRAHMHQSPSPHASTARLIPSRRKLWDTFSWDKRREDTFKVFFVVAYPFNAIRCCMALRLNCPNDSLAKPFYSYLKEVKKFQSNGSSLIWSQFQPFD